jgi:hypothetical protein
METVINNDNRNILVKRVISGEIPLENATLGLARVEVNIFFRKLDRAAQTMNSQQSQFMSDIPHNLCLTFQFLTTMLNPPLVTLSRMNLREHSRSSLNLRLR